jgi:hypothetical protein
MLGPSNAALQQLSGALSVTGTVTAPRREPTFLNLSIHRTTILAVKARRNVS